jgi:hypothetical protein
MLSRHDVKTSKAFCAPNARRLNQQTIGNGGHITRPSLVLLAVAIDVSVANSANNHRPDILASIVLSLVNGFSFLACKPSFQGSCTSISGNRQHSEFK